MTVDKKKITIGGLGLLALIITLFIFLAASRSKQNRNDEATRQPEMMSVEEKRASGIPEEMEIQVMSRDEDGGIMTYKKIDSPEEIEAVAPAIIRAR